MHNGQLLWGKWCGAAKKRFYLSICFVVLVQLFCGSFLSGPFSDQPIYATATEKVRYRCKKGWYQPSDPCWSWLGRALLIPSPSKKCNQLLDCRRTIAGCLLTRPCHLATLQNLTFFKGQSNQSSSRLFYPEWRQKEKGLYCNFKRNHQKPPLAGQFGITQPQVGK